MSLALIMAGLGKAFAAAQAAAPYASLAISGLKTLKRNSDSMNRQTEMQDGNPGQDLLGTVLDITNKKNEDNYDESEIMSHIRDGVLGDKVKTIFKKMGPTVNPGLHHTSFYKNYMQRQLEKGGKLKLPKMGEDIVEKAVNIPKRGAKLVDMFKTLFKSKKLEL
jgi:hypothetical protein